MRISNGNPFGFFKMVFAIAVNTIIYVKCMATMTYFL